MVNREWDQVHRLVLFLYSEMNSEMNPEMNPGSERIDVETNPDQDSEQKPDKDLNKKSQRRKGRLSFKPWHYFTVAGVFAVIAVLTVTGVLTNAWLAVTSDGSEQTPDGTVYSSGDRVGTMADGASTIKYAPRPEKEFRDAKCDLTPKKQGNPPSLLSWDIPSIDSKSEMQPDDGDGTLNLPDAPKGTSRTVNAQLGDKTGAIFQAGHVDYAPGILSSEGGELSPWGHLHRLDPCAYVYERGADGKDYEFVVTDLYTVKQDQLKDQKDLFRLDGPLSLYLITCSGKSVGDDGGSADNRLGFNYEYNLIVKAVPVKA